MFKCSIITFFDILFSLPFNIFYYSTFFFFYNLLNHSLFYLFFLYHLLDVSIFITVLFVLVQRYCCKFYSLFCKTCSCFSQYPCVWCALCNGLVNVPFKVFHWVLSIFFISFFYSIYQSWHKTTFKMLQFYFHGIISLFAYSKLIQLFYWKYFFQSSILTSGGLERDHWHDI